MGQARWGSWEQRAGFLLSGSRPDGAQPCPPGASPGPGGLSPLSTCRLCQLSHSSHPEPPPTPCCPTPRPHSLYSHTRLLMLTCTLSSSVDVGGQPTPQTWARAFPVQSTPPGTSSCPSLLLTFNCLGIFSLWPPEGEGRGGVQRMRKGGREVLSPPHAALATSPQVRPALVTLGRGAAAQPLRRPIPLPSIEWTGPWLGSWAGDMAVSL